MRTNTKFLRQPACTGRHSTLAIFMAPDREFRDRFLTREGWIKVNGIGVTGLKPARRHVLAAGHRAIVPSEVSCHGMQFRHIWQSGTRCDLRGPEHDAERPPCAGCLTEDAVARRPTSCVAVAKDHVSNGPKAHVLHCGSFPMCTPSPPPPEMPIVNPSGADLAIASTPSTLPAPDRFSTTTDWPRSFSNAGCIARATASVAPPAGNGTIKRRGLSGKVCR